MTLRKHFQRSLAVPAISLALGFGLVMVPTSAVLADTTIAELQALDRQGRLTIRALRAWNQLPAPLMQVVLELHQHGIDVLGADRAALGALVESARAAGEGPAFVRLADLQALVSHMAGFTAPVPTSPLDHAEGTDALALAVTATARQQREIAREIYRQITALEDWEHEAIERLYLRLMDAAPETLEAEEAYWRLGNLYMRGFEPARNAETAALLEHYRERYPDSDLLDRRFALFSSPGLSVVESRLLYLYDELEAWEKAAALYARLIPDPATAPQDLVERFIAYGRTLEELGRKEEAVVVYQAYLEFTEKPSSILQRAAQARLQALGAIPMVAVRHDNVFTAAAEGHLEEVRRHVEAGADLNAYYQVGSRLQYTALQFAVSEGHGEVVDYLLGHGAAPDRLGGWGEGQVPALMLAVPRGEVGIVARLLAAGADVDLRDREGRSALHLAAAPEAAGIDVVDTLLGAGANRHAADARGWRPFDLAVANGRADLLDALYAREQDLDRALPSGATPLFLAAERKHAGVVEKLLALGASVDVLDSQGESALFAAVRAEQDEIVRRLLAHGADVNRANNRAAVPLHFALGARNAALVALLLEQGAAQDQPYQRELPLHWVAQDGSLDAAARVTMLNALLAGEIEVDTLDSRGHTALQRAAGRGDVQAAAVLLAAGARADFTDDRGNTLLHRAASDGHGDLVAVLAQAGVAVDALNGRGETALHVASEHGRVEAVAALLAAGADPDLSDRDGRTALLRAHRRAREAVVELFVDKGLLIYPDLLQAATDGDTDEVGRHLARGADVTAIDDEGNTALHLAVYGGHAEASRRLIAAGAALDARNARHAAPLHLAAAIGHSGLIDLLREHGADARVWLAEHTVDADGNTVLHRAVRDGHAEIVHMLTERGVALESVNLYDETPLLQAFQYALGACEEAAWEAGARIAPLAQEHPAQQIMLQLLARGARVDTQDAEGYTPLHLTALMGDRDLAERLLDGGARLDAATQDGLQPVHMAMLFGHAALADWMIERGARVEMSTHGGRLLHGALRREHERLPVIRLLLDHGADIDARDEDGRTLLFGADLHDQALFDLLLSRGADVNAVHRDGTTLLVALSEMRDDPDALARAERLVALGAETTGAGWPPLRVAALRGESARVAALLAEGTEDDDDADTDEGWAWSVLHAAARVGHAEVVQTLLDGGIDLQAAEATSPTPLLLAARHGHREVFSLLLERGANPAVLGQALYEAIAYDNDRHAVERLHAAGVDLNAAYLSEAPVLFMTEDADMLSFLVGLGANVDQTVEDGTTRLFEAVKDDDEVMVVALLAQGARTDTRGGVWERTPLHVAVEREHPDILALLLVHGADLEARDNDGRTALHLAADSGSLPAARQLVEHGADLDARDGREQTPQQLAAHGRHAEVLNFLRDAQRGAQGGE